MSRIGRKWQISFCHRAYAFPRMASGPTHRTCSSLKKRNSRIESVLMKLNSVFEVSKINSF